MMEGGHSVILSLGNVGCCWFEPLCCKVLLHSENFPVFELLLLLLTAVSSKAELWPCSSISVHAKKKRFSASL